MVIKFAFIMFFMHIGHMRVIFHSSQILSQCQILFIKSCFLFCNSYYFSFQHLTFSVIFSITFIISYACCFWSCIVGFCTSSVLKSLLALPNMYSQLSPLLITLPTHFLCLLTVFHNNSLLCLLVLFFFLYDFSYHFHFSLFIKKL